MKIPAIAVCAIATALAAQSQTVIDSPLLGMVLDRNAARLRPVYGVPGAATMGDPLDTGNDISAAAVSPTGRYALVLSGADSHAALLFADNAKETPIAGVPSGVSQLALSPDGTAGALYYSSERVVRVVSGLTGVAAQQVRSIDVSALPSTKPLLAVSDDGASVLYSAGTYETFILGGESGLRRVAMSDVPTALAFRQGSRNALIATAAGAEWIEDVGLRISTRHVSLDRNSTAASYIGISRDGTQGIFMESAGRVSVAGLNSTTGSGDSANSVNCRCTDFAPQPAAGGTGYILSEYNGKSISLLDASTSPARVFTIPPAGAASKAQGRLQ